ncbi:MAG: hypothetical protein H7287_04375 [Thermoleophilia bacterium]|nr:hypothetical protein [Thermoleophilia bacterium]
MRRDSDMHHDIEMTRTRNERMEVPDGLHLRCSCGWTSSAHDEATVEAVAREHLAVRKVAPAPAAPSPN